MQILTPLEDKMQITIPYLLLELILINIPEI